MHWLLEMLTGGTDVLRVKEPKEAAAGSAGMTEQLDYTIPGFSDQGHSMCKHLKL